MSKIKDFTQLKLTYRARLDFPEGVTFISNRTFEDYDECFNFAKEESKKYPLCGFCVVFNHEPQLTIDSPFDL